MLLANLANPYWSNCDEGDGGDADYTNFSSALAPRSCPLCTGALAKPAISFEESIALPQPLQPRQGDRLSMRGKVSK